MAISWLCDLFLVVHRKICLIPCAISSGRPTAVLQFSTERHSFSSAKKAILGSEPFGLRESNCIPRLFEIRTSLSLNSMAQYECRDIGMFKK